MLDECKGEKFEEVLLHLSTAVLRKVVRERNSKKGGASAAQRLCLSNGWSATEEGAVNVLPYAHEASIQRSLQERKARRQKLSTLNANLSARTTSMQREHDHLDLELRQQHWSLQTANVDAQSMKTRMRQHSPGHAHWLNLAMSGDLEHGRDAMIEDQFKKVWSNAMAVEDQAPYDPIPSSVLADLERRVKLQQGRLARWRGFQEELSRRNEDLIVAQSPAKTPFKSPLKKFGSPQKTTPRRAASTRKPERAASVENTSTRLQSLQVSPTKSLSNSAKPNEAEARDATGPLQPPLDLRPLPAPSDSADDPEALCADMADLQLSSVAPGSPTRRPLTHPHQQRTLLPSPSKSPGEQSTTTLHASSVHAAMQTTPPDNVSTTGSGNNINGAQLGYEHEAAETKPQCAVSTPPTPVETLTERTARTMAEWQQKAMIVQATGTASHSRTGSSATANPHRHKHTRSIPVASITSGSPERVVGDTAIQMKARPHRFDGSADCAGSLGSPSQCGADSAEQRSSELGCTSSAVYTDPRSGDHDGLVLASKTSAQSGQQELDEPAVDDESPFKPRNRLRRTPPTSPSPWAAAESNQDYH